MTDEECIAIAVLHGADMNYATNGDVGPGMRAGWILGKNWFGVPHPIESDLQQRHPDHHNYFDTRADLARAYCKYYGLLEEVT